MSEPVPPNASSDPTAPGDSAHPPGLSLWRLVFRHKLPLEHETSGFILANVLDFLMTYWLLMQQTAARGQYIESNAVARFFLNHWGLRGLLVFKLAVVLFVCLVAQIVAINKLHLARTLLYIGTAIVCAAVFYSLYLYIQHSHPGLTSPDL